MGWKKLTLTVGILLLISCSFSIIAEAQVPWEKFSYWNNTGGLNDQLSETEIADDEASVLQNIVLDSGVISKRFGYLTIPRDPVEKVGTGSVVAITGLAFYEKNDGSRFIVAICNNDAKATAMKKDYETGGGLKTGSWENIDFVSLPSSYDDDYFADFAVAEDKLVFTLEATTKDKPFVWDGAASSVGYLTTDTDCPDVSLLEYHRRHLFLAGNDTNPSRVYFSELDDITGYEALDFFDVATSDGTRVRGLISAYGSLYVFKDRSIWRLSGAERDTFYLEQMVSGIGTKSGASVRIVNNFIYFTTAQNDIAVYDGAYKVTFISQKIRNTIGGLNFTRATNTLGLAFSTYKYNDYDYYCAVSTAGSGTNNKVLLFDTAYNAWLPFKGMDVNAWTVADDSVGQDTMFFGDYSGYVHQYPSTQYYDGNVETPPISAFYETKWFKYADLALGDKYWRLLKTYTLTEDTGTFLFAEARSDYEDSGKILTLDIAGSGSQWDLATWDVDTWGGQGLLVNRSEIEKGKSMFQIKFYNETVNQGFTILGFENFIEPTDRI